MKTQNTKAHIKDYYTSQCLSSDKLTALNDLADKYDEKVERVAVKGKVSIVKSFFEERRFALVASFMFVIAGFWGFINFEQNQYLKGNFAQIVAQEISMNHRKQLKLDFNSADYEMLAANMSKLDFNILESTNENLHGLSIVGARYCSIQGNIAAQIRLKNEKDEYFTLYQTQLTDLLKKTKEDIQIMDNIKVMQWQENGLFFGLATAAN